MKPLIILGFSSWILCFSQMLNASECTDLQTTSTPNTEINFQENGWAFTLRKWNLKTSSTRKCVVLTAIRTGASYTLKKDYNDK